MGQTPELARMAQEFILIVIPNIFLSFTTVALRKFLQGLGNDYHNKQTEDSFS
jgi:Na+-driven multidrug efflux pump